MHALLLASAIFVSIHSNARFIPVAPAETLAVTIRGTGRAVVIVPGLLGGAYGYRHVAAGLAEAGYSTAVVDPLGTGGSSRPPDADYSFTAQAARVAAALDTLGLRNAVLIVHAAGAPIGYRMALTRPDLVARIISINGGPVETLNTPGVATALRLSPLLRLFGAERKARDKLVNGLRDVSYDPAWVTDAVIDAYAADYRKDLWGTLRMLRRMSRAEDPWPLQPALSGISAPVLLLRSADRPQSVPDAEVAVLQDSVPFFTVEYIHDTGQYIQEERPDAVIAAVLANPPVTELCDRRDTAGAMPASCRE